MRFAGALLLSLPLLRAALRRAETLKRRERLLCSFCEFFRRLSETSAWRQLELPGMLRHIGAQMADFTFPALVLAGFESGGDLSAAWAAAVGQLPLLQPEETSALLAFSAVFESASARVFAEKCALAAERFACFSQAAHAERLRKTRLTVSLGVFGAALLTILLL